MSGLYTGMRLLDSPSPTWSSDSSEENEYGETAEKVESAFRSIDAPLGSKRRYGNDDGSLIRIKIPRIEWLAPANKASFDEPMYREYSFDPRSFGSVELASSSSSDNPIQTEQPSSGAGISVSSREVVVPRSITPSDIGSITECSSVSDSSDEEPVVPPSISPIVVSERKKKRGPPKGYHFAFWTKEDTEVCESMWKAGSSIDEISNKLGRTTGAVRGKLYGITKRKPKGKKELRRVVLKWKRSEKKLCEAMIDDGKSADEIAAKLGRSIFAIKARMQQINAAKPPGQKFLIRKDPLWTNEELTLCKTMASRGKSYREISDRIGRTINAVRRKLPKYKMKGADAKKLECESLWTAREESLCKKLSDEGKSLDVIAARIQKSPEVVKQILNTLSKQACGGGK